MKLIDMLNINVKIIAYNGRSGKPSGHIYSDIILFFKNLSCG